MKVWISALIPADGGDCYDGLRLAAFESERQAYLDLALWLFDAETQASNDEIAWALDEAKERGKISSWKIEAREVEINRSRPPRLPVSKEVKAAWANARKAK